MRATCPLEDGEIRTVLAESVWLVLEGQRKAQESKPDWILLFFFGQLLSASALCCARKQVRGPRARHLAKKSSYCSSELDLIHF